MLGDILGVLRLSDMAVSREKPLEPTETVHICRANGHLFTGDPIPNQEGKLEARTVEYDPDLRTSQCVTAFLPGTFSPTCRYVATEQNSHGPLPWDIIDVTNGHPILHFDYTGEGTKEEFEFHSWNPRRDEIFLRFMDPPLNGKNGAQNPVLQVFDLRQQRVLQSFDNFSGNVAWSKDGKSLLGSRGHSLVFHPIFTGH